MIAEQLLSGIQIHAWNKPISLSYDAKNIFLIDDYGLAYIGTTNLTTSLNVSTLEMHSQLRVPVRFNEVGHWQKLEYDPHLASLFAGAPITTDSPQAHSLGQRFVTWKAVLIAISIVSVALVATLSVYLYLRKKTACTG